MKKFKDVKIGQSFYTSNGKPSKKISNTKAVSLVPELSGLDFQEAIEDVQFSQKEQNHVYGIGKATGYTLTKS